MKKLVVLIAVFILGLAAGEGEEPQSGIFLIKTDSLGNVEWERVYAECEDCLGFAKPTSGGGYLVAGSIHHSNSEDDYFWLAKTDSAGNILWEKKYGVDPKKHKMAVSSDMVGTEDNCWILGITQTNVFHEKYGVVLVKINNQGEVLWTHLVPEASVLWYQLYKTSEDELFMIGFDIFLHKIDTLGCTKWLHDYSKELGVKGSAYRMKQTLDRGFIIVGACDTLKDKFEGRLFILKTDSLGTMEWTKSYGRGWGNDVLVTSDGGYVITGASERQGSKDVWLLRLDENGDTLWTKTYGDSESKDYGRRIVSTPDGGYTIMAYTQSSSAPLNDIWVLRTNSQGDTLWTRTYGSPLDDFAGFLEETHDGGYIISGYIEPLESK